AADESARGQLLDLHAIDGLAIELPVKLSQRLAFVEAGFADAIGDAAFATLGRLRGDEPVQELLVRQTLPLGTGQDRVELRGGERHLEGSEVGQDAFTQVGRRRRGVRRCRLPWAGFGSAVHERSLAPRGADSRWSG